MIRHIARLVLACPKFWAIGSVITTLVMAVCMTQISFDIQPSATITSDNQTSRDLARFHDEYGRDDNDVVLLIEGDDLLQWNQLQQLRKLRDQLQELPGVQYVASILDVRRRTGSMIPLIPRDVADDGAGFDAETLLSELIKHPISKDQLISDDGKMLAMWARIEGDSLAVSGITQVIEPTKRFARQYETDTGATVHIAGHTAIRDDVLNSLQRAMFISCTAAAIVAFFVALALFRGLVAVVVVVTAPAVGAIWTFGLMAACGEQVGGLLTALPNLVFTIGLTDSVHLLLEMQNELRAGRTSRNAAYRGLVRVGPACWLTSVTTVIGFGSLMLSRTPSVAAFGMWTAVGTSFAMLANIVVLPTLVMWLPKRWLITNATATHRMSDWIERMVAPMVRRSRLTAAIGVGLCVLLLGPALSQEPDIVWTETIPDHSSSAVAMRHADDKLGGALLCYVTVRWPESYQMPDSQIIKATARAQSILRAAPQFSGTFSIGNVLASVPGRTMRDRFRMIDRMPEAIQSGLMNESARSLVVTARVPNDGAAALNKRIQGVDVELEALRQEFPDFEFTITGTVVAASRNMNLVIMDLARSLAVAAVLIFIVFTIAFRSIKTGLLSVVPNVLPLLVTAAGLSFCGYPLLITAALTFSLCLGLAVDDTLHLLIRYRAVRRYDRDARSAAMKAVRQVGPALVVTTIILFSGFAAMMTSPLPGVRLFAGLSALTLVTALIGDLLIFPAMLVVGSSSSESKD
ncbi:efflux RND transporter permease subunit [Stieleria varia]|uniref:Multidrug efflux system subunit MdtC n=1 Tax=Stieleria varia TaxID=2528005 RepID=A0A5C6A5B9_9BACT|nr:MMPL family transporter [Stieleria varia]TWT94498.1 multidrug efflux system subunit MdtC [Stieleria varia]